MGLNSERASRARSATEPLTIVITDCDHDSIDAEVAVAAGHGIVLERHQCSTEDEVIEAARNADGLLVQYAPITARVLDALPQLRAVGRYGVGVDTVDVEAATARGVAVCNVPDYGTEDVSDHAIALTMAMVRGIARLDRQIRSGGYDYAEVRPLHRTSHQVFGVLGLGLIGSATARKAKGIGFRVLGFDPLHEVGTITPGGVEVVDLGTLLSTVDILSLHVPLNAATEHILDAESIARLKPGASIVNTARGGLVDTEALAHAVRSGHLAGAALDVFEREPIPATSPLLALPNVVLTPHISWYSEESYGELKNRTIQNVVDVLEGRRPRDIFNPEGLR